MSKFKTLGLVATQSSDPNLAKSSKILNHTNYKEKFPTRNFPRAAKIERKRLGPSIFFQNEHDGHTLKVRPCRDMFLLSVIGVELFREIGLGGVRCTPPGSIGLTEKRTIRCRYEHYS